MRFRSYGRDLWCRARGPKEYGRRALTLSMARIISTASALWMAVEMRRAWCAVNEGAVQLYPKWE